MARCHRISGAAASAVALSLSLCASAAAGTAPDSRVLDRGRYLVRIAGCNDCHTPGYTQANGKIPEDRWLTGDTLGWRGPWGTTYASNLRRYMATLSEQEWLAEVQTRELRPPMPWFNLRHMSQHDLRAVYRFVRHLGPTGTEAPAFLPPGKEPDGPFVLFPAPPPP